MKNRALRAVQRKIASHTLVAAVMMVKLQEETEEGEGREVKKLCQRYIMGKT